MDIVEILSMLTGFVATLIASFVLDTKADSVRSLLHRLLARIHQPHSKRIIIV